MRVSGIAPTRDSPRRLALGKIPISILNATVLRMVGANSDRVVTPASAGVDFAAIRIGLGYIVVSSDPVTGVSDEIGRYAVTVSANDVATCGHPAQFAESVILLPEGSRPNDVARVARQVHQAAKDAGIAIVGGHTEVTPGLRRPIVMVTAFGFVEDYVSSRDAASGDTIMMTKTAGLEGTAVLTGSRRLLDDLSVIPEATLAYGTGRVHAMHDCTEGGVLGAVFEMALAAGLGFELNSASVPVADATKDVCRRKGIDPLKLISSGALLLSVEAGKEEEVAKAVSPVRITTIGRFTSSGRFLIGRSGRKNVVRSAPEDELWRALGRSSGGRDRL